MSEAEKSTWQHRRGNPGGAWSAEEMRARSPHPVPPELAIDDPALRAFLTGAREHFREALDLLPWEDSPLVNRRERCTQGHAIEAAMAPGYGCHDQHRAATLRGRIIAELETRGAFTWADLAAVDDEVARVAWGRLAGVAEAVGVTEEQWTDVLRRAGWDGTWQKANDGA